MTETNDLTRQEQLELALWRTRPVIKRALMELCGLPGAMEDFALIEDLRTVLRNIEEVLKPLPPEEHLPPEEGP